MKLQGQKHELISSVLKERKKRLEQCKDKLRFGVGFSTTLQGVAAVANHMPEPEANDGYMLTSTYTLLQQ